MTDPRAKIVAAVTGPAASIVASVVEAARRRDDDGCAGAGVPVPRTPLIPFGTKVSRNADGKYFPVPDDDPHAVAWVIEDVYERVESGIVTIPPLIDEDF